MSRKLLQRKTITAILSKRKEEQVFFLDPKEYWQLKQGCIFTTIPLQLAGIGSLSEYRAGEIGEMC